MLRQLLISGLLVIGAIWLWVERDMVLTRLDLAAAEPPAAARRAPEGVPVIVAPVRLARDDLEVEVVGSGRAERSVTLKAEAAGKIIEMALEPGRRFAAGDVLLRLDDSEERLARALAEARLAEAKRVRQRYTRLQSSGAAADARLDEVATAAEVAEIELARAEEALSDRLLRAPFDGVSGLPEVEVGDRITTDIAIASFDDRSTVLVEFPLPEALQARVSAGMPVTARTPAHPKRAFEGHVVAIDSRVDVTTRTTTLRVAIPNEADLLRPGASFSIGMSLPGETYPLVPELAVQFSSGSLHVWRVSGDRVERVEIDLVRRRAGEVLVEGALAEGDRVVIEGTQRLAPGKTVRVIGPDAAGAGS
ncbi:efflux RND transporter periplasmic adaptor subunit [Paralimibaculum aggregatum]|uniref:Efflux RND transporter periplasmic adaptor subunit n=1 Tax=Paralimibaculum aggregatum TaxID=3036245 RepID=A0ABQ6LPH8_9RHOB|nr:efflux RND transporter periplasmic adaptor subunit [Limibaculum sp. NKW23]GMG82240.1 efflux RND transporter periplasmic adaptor subunit [Limibaculum sp. NKW23]